ncbi:hypothetical protein ACFV5G_35335 [Streptomyces sp. NPDC059766]|uniref:hypothetical protein n=1 Tax=Streptomyces sp. NPDC059766 TaxID=3346940 RepID=UPI003648EA96
MTQRKNTYRAALHRDPAEPGSSPARSTTLSTRFVRITIELEPDAARSLDRWTAPAISLLSHTRTTALELLSALTRAAPAATADQQS